MNKIQIILGSTRPNRFGETVAKWVNEQAQKRDDFEYELIDLREVNLPMFNEPRSPAAGDYEHQHTKEWTKKVSEADGYLIVTPEYNHGYPAVLKNALDYAYKEWNEKPVGFVGYGSMGATRSIQQLKLVAIELQMAPIRSAVHINKHWDKFDDKGNLKDKSFNNGLSKVLDKLEKWTVGFKDIRAN